MKHLCAMYSLCFGLNYAVLLAQLVSRRGIERLTNEPSIKPSANIVQVVDSTSNREHTPILNHLLGHKIAQLPEYF